MGNQDPEFADVARFARRLLSRAVETARAPDRPLRRVLVDHLHAEVVLQVAGADADRIGAVLAEIRRLAAENSVFRGQVISFQPEVFGPARAQSVISFLERPTWPPRWSSCSTLAVSSPGPSSAAGRAIPGKRVRFRN